MLPGSPKVWKLDKYCNNSMTTSLSGNKSTQVRVRKSHSVQIKQHLFRQSEMYEFNTYTYWVQPSINTEILTFAVV